MIDLEDLLSSTVSGKSILCIEPGNNIPYIGFSGLNIKKSNIHYIHLDETPLINTDGYFDYIIVHGFLLNDIDKQYQIITKTNFSCDTFIIDLLGEGGWLVDSLEHFNFDIVKSNHIKVLSPIDDYVGLEEKHQNIEFFKYDFCGPRNFCSRYNHTIHQDTLKTQYDASKVVMGLHWNNQPREKLFTCLNNRKESHRSILIDQLLKNDVMGDGYVSNINGVGYTEIDFYKEDHFTETIYDKKIILDATNIPSDRFGVHKWGSKSYIDVVTETSHNLMRFMTEKSVKPFYNLQLPIILGYNGIIQHLRDLGFDMFDDIINHSYDLIDSGVTVYDGGYKIHSVYNTIAKEKSKLIVNELQRLSKLDFHSIYLDLKERLIHNQNLLYKLTIEDNNLVEDYGRWIFGDNITFNKNEYIETIYI